MNPIRLIHLSDLHRTGNDPFTNAELIAIPAVQALFQSEVDHYNEAFGSYERIKKFYLVPEEWSIQSGELTPSMKLKRRILHEKYAAQIDAFYKEA